MKPKIVLVITDQETNAQIAKLGVDFLELRVDLFKKAGVAHALRQFQIRRALKVRLLLTVRDQKKEGALKPMATARKWELLRALMPLTDWVDIELSSPLRAKAIALARRLKKKVVISMHDFKRVPPNLGGLLKKALKGRADIIKIAVHANSQDDLMRMAVFTRDNRKHPLATMCLGPWGGLSRLVLPVTGSRWIYTFLRKPTAPGQVDIKTLKSQLKFLPNW